MQPFYFSISPFHKEVNQRNTSKVVLEGLWKKMIFISFLLAVEVTK